MKNKSIYDNSYILKNGHTNYYFSYSNIDICIQTTKYENYKSLRLVTNNSFKMFKVDITSLH